MYIGNAFSLNMLPSWAFGGNLRFQRLTLEQARDLVQEFDYTSAVGHADVAALFTEALGVPVPMNRINAELLPGLDDDRILVGQYFGPRLPEGTTTLPEGAEIRWVLVALWEDGLDLDLDDVQEGY